MVVPLLIIGSSTSFQECQQKVLVAPLVKQFAEIVDVGGLRVGGVVEPRSILAFRVWGDFGYFAIHLDQ